MKMNSKYKFICVILACVLILPVLSSCAGIGDGALTPESGATKITDPPVEMTEETKGEETVAIKTEPDLNTERSDFAKLGNVIGCAVFRFNYSGEQQERSYPVSDLAKTLYTDLAYGKLDSNAVRKNTISDYITVEFTDSEGMVEKYCVWADNFVMKMRAGNSMTNTPLGTISGAYAKCEEYVLTYKG
jgi:hypothetical protein